MHDEGTTARNRKEGKGLFDRFTILDRLCRDASSEEQRMLARAVLVRQFQVMFARAVEKYLKGERISGKGSGIVKRFILRHPLMVAQALLRAALSRGEEWRGQGRDDLEQDYSLFPAQ